MALLNSIYRAIYEEKQERDKISEINYAKKEAYIRITRSLLKIGMSEKDIFEKIEGLSEFLSLEEIEKIKHKENNKEYRSK